jgi:hypothetical protein
MGRGAEQIFLSIQGFRNCLKATMHLILFHLIGHSTCLQLSNVKLLAVANTLHSPTLAPAYAPVQARICPVIVISHAFLSRCRQGHL